MRKQPDRKSPVKRGSSREVLHERDDDGAQAELAERFEAERIKLDQDLVDGRRALESKHAAAMADLEARKLAELARLWRRQGRQLGPGMLRALGELAGWKGAPDVSA